MAVQISEKCVSCGSCEIECPNHAIYEGGTKWTMAKGTKVKGAFTLMDGTVVDADQRNPSQSFDTFYIVASKCTECVGFHDKPQCADACQVGACVVSPLYPETMEQLLAKKGNLHGLA